MKTPLPADDAASPSRRSVLTALAAVPVAGVLALAGVANTSEPDPVFTLIDAAKLALKAHEEALENIFDPAQLQAEEMGFSPWDFEAYPPLKAADEKIGVLGSVQVAAEDAVLDAKPRTLAGLAGQLIIAAGVWLHNEPDHDRLLSLLVNAARLVGGPEIEIPEELAEFISYVDQPENES